MSGEETCNKSYVGRLLARGKREGDDVLGVREERTCKRCVGAGRLRCKQREDVQEVQGGRTCKSERREGRARSARGEDMQGVSGGMNCKG